MEGRFLPEVKKGTQNGSFLRKPDFSLYHQLQTKAQGLIRIVDVAPEEDTDYQLIKAASRTVHTAVDTLTHTQTTQNTASSLVHTHTTQNTVLSLAHTQADYTTCMKAFAAGASHVTHLFNAMPPFSHRAPGLVGAAFDTPSCNVELICDGIHASPTAIHMDYQLFTDERIVLISDSMRATGMPNGNYTLGVQDVIVKTSPHIDTAIATLLDGTIAGSVTNLMDCLRKTVSFGIPLERALRCATANPAQCIGAAACVGYLKPGYVGNIVFLDETLQVKYVILRGKLLR